MENEARPDSAPRHSTLLALVWELQGSGASADDVALTAARLVNEGQVVLTGNFRGCRLDLGASGSLAG